MGLEWREEAEGRLYPLANKASSVLDVLRGAARVLGVEERCGCAVAQVEPPASYGGKGKRFTLHVADGSFERADAVIVACGGRTARMMLPDGFAYAEPQPVLGPLATEAHLTRQLDNIRVRGVARLLRDGEEVARESGEVLFRKYGLSGIAVFNLSRFARAGDVIELDVLPSVAQRDAESYAFRRYETLALLHGGGLTCGDYLRGLVLPQVARTVLKEIGFDEDAVLTCRQATAIIGAFKNLRFAVGGVADERQCQVHRGGFSVQEFDARTMQARTLPGLFLAGEALDVDAPCGGYNLHWAWASGMLAGWNAAGCLLGPSTSTPGEEPAKKESGEAGVSC